MVKNEPILDEVIDELLVFVGDEGSLSIIAWVEYYWGWDAIKRWFEVTSILILQDRVSQDIQQRRINPIGRYNYGKL